MSGELLFRVIGDIDEDLVLNAAPDVTVKSSRKIWHSLVAMFAAFLVVLSAFFVRLSLRSNPQKPSADRIVWAETVSDGSVGTSAKYNEIERINAVLQNDKYISPILLNAMLKDSGNVPYAIILTNKNGCLKPGKKELELFLRQGIFAEIVDQTLYLYPTSSQFQSLSIPNSQDYVFVLAIHTAYAE